MTCSSQSGGLIGPQTHRNIFSRSAYDFADENIERPVRCEGSVQSVRREPHKAFCAHDTRAALLRCIGRTVGSFTLTPKRYQCNADEPPRGWLTDRDKAELKRTVQEYNSVQCRTVLPSLSLVPRSFPSSMGFTEDQMTPNLSRASPLPATRSKIKSFTRRTDQLVTDPSCCDIALVLEAYIGLSKCSLFCDLVCVCLNDLVFCVTGILGAAMWLFRAGDKKQEKASCRRRFESAKRRSELALSPGKLVRRSAVQYGVRCVCKTQNVKDVPVFCFATISCRCRPDTSPAWRQRNRSFSCSRKGGMSRFPGICNEQCAACLCTAMRRLAVALGAFNGWNTSPY